VILLLCCVAGTAAAADDDVQRGAFTTSFSERHPLNTPAEQQRRFDWDKPFEDYDITNGTTVTDLAIRNVVYTPAGQDPSCGKGVLIASYAWEQDSMAYSMLGERDRIAEALQDLAKIHPEARETFEELRQGRNGWANERGIDWGNAVVSLVRLSV
jgi:monoamine oxidase